MPEIYVYAGRVAAGITTVRFKDYRGKEHTYERINYRRRIGFRGELVREMLENRDHDCRC